MVKWFILVFLILSLDLSAQVIPYRRYEPRELKLPYISPELNTYVMSYLDDLAKEGIDISGVEKLDSILLVPWSQILCESPTAIGCAYGNSVRIKCNWYFSFDRMTYLRVLIYHELGHAVLRIPHFSNRIHIMNTSIYPSIRIYDTYWSIMRKDYILYFYYCRMMGNQL